MTATCLLVCSGTEYAVCGHEPGWDVGSVTALHVGCQQPTDVRKIDYSRCLFCPSHSYVPPGCRCRGDYEQLRVWFVVVAVLVGDASWNLKRHRLECKPTQDKNKRDAEVRMTGEINRFTVHTETW